MIHGVEITEADKAKYLPIFRATRELIERKWRQGGGLTSLDDQGCGCLLCCFTNSGGEDCGYISRHHPASKGYYLMIHAIYGEQIGGHGGVAGWNDHKGRTKAEVLGLVDRIIEALQ